MSVAWVTIAVGDLNDHLVAKQVDAYRTKALASGQADPWTNVMHERCNYVRLRLTNRILISSTAYAVPPELKTQTVALIIEVLAARLPGIRLPENWSGIIRRAYQDLDIAATPEFPVSMPTDPVPQSAQVGGPCVVVNSTTRRFTATSLNGF
jgi:hypothetical protein